MPRAHCRARSTSSALGGSPALRNFSVMRRHPTSTDRTRSSARPRSAPMLPTAISVEPPPLSATRISRSAKSCATPKNVRDPSTSPGITCACSPRAASSARSASEFAASRAAEVSVQQIRGARACRAAARYESTHASTRTAAASAIRPVRVRPSPRLQIVDCFSIRVTRPPSTSATASLAVTVPMSMHATLVISAPSSCHSQTARPEPSCTTRGRPCT